MSIICLVLLACFGCGNIARGASAATAIDASSPLERNDIAAPMYYCYFKFGNMIFLSENFDRILAQIKDKLKTFSEPLVLCYVPPYQRGIATNNGEFRAYVTGKSVDALSSSITGDWEKNMEKQIDGFNCNCQKVPDSTKSADIPIIQEDLANYNVGGDKKCLYKGKAGWVGVKVNAATSKLLDTK